MKSDKLQNAIGMVDGDLVLRAEKYKKKRKYIKWVTPIAAALVVVLLLSTIFGNGLFERKSDTDSFPYNSFPYIFYGGDISYPTVEFTPVSLAPYCLSEVVYPQKTKNPNVEGGNTDLWFEEIRERRGYYGAGENLENYFKKTVEEFLSDSDGRNVMYSPLNVYMALAMVAETAQGDSRQQILDLLEAEDIESLRTQAHAIWNANHQDDGITTSLLASSLWLDESLSYNKELLDILADNYYASVYQGEMGSDEYNDALRTWINEQTGGLLKNELSGVVELLPADAILSLATTVYFKDQWAAKFDEKDTYKERFYTPMGYKDIDFMHDTIMSMPYYKGDDFSSVIKGMGGGNEMYFIRPDDGVDVDDLLSDKELYSYIMSEKNDENMRYSKVNLSIPKFDVSSELDITEGLQNIGIRDCFNPSGTDFNVFSDTDNNTNVYISDIQHTARVKIDEKGVEAAAVTQVVWGHGAAFSDEEIDFILDKPFIFVIANEDGLPLFTGVVNNP